MGAYDPIPTDSPLIGVAKDLRRRQRRAADTTAGQLHNTATRTKDQFDFLLGQTTTSPATTKNDVMQELRQVRADETWRDFDPERDAQVTMVTSSSGIVIVEWAGHVYSELYGGGTKSTMNTEIAVEIIGVKPPTTNGSIAVETVSVKPPMTRGSIAAQTESMGLVGSGGRFSSFQRFELDPFAQYSFRTRRGYDHNIAGPNSWASHNWNAGTVISVRKEGI